MRQCIGLFASAALLGLASAANAMPPFQPGQAGDYVSKIVDGCGHGSHRTPWGRCTPDRPPPPVGWVPQPPGPGWARPLVMPGADSDPGEPTPDLVHS
jgi:hypothetical protein